MTRDHLAAGLSHKLVDGDGLIIASAWHRAVEGKEIVGTCRQPKAKGMTCEGFLVAKPAYQLEGSKVTWFEAECLKCHHEVCAPNGKTLARSSRHNEMPGGWWDRYIKTVKAIFGKEA